MSSPRITIVGSVNLDLVAAGPRLPSPGQTVTDAVFAKYPGGKGANQALAARRLGAEVCLIARVGNDGFADEALQLLALDGVDLERVRRDPEAPTGVALITVAAGGENQITVAPGANARLAATDIVLPAHDAVICQLEVPEATIAAAADQCSGLLCLNLAPAKPLPRSLLERASLIVVNETEAEFYGAMLHDLPATVALTLGRAGAELRRAGRQIASARPPAITAIDTTAAGDAFVAALTLALVERHSPQSALEFACAAGAAAASAHGAQPSLPHRAQVLTLLQAS
jgi:ribokinase